MIKICQTCRKSFLPTQYPGGRIEDRRTYGKRKYCSKTCADIGKRKYERDWYEKHKEDIRKQKRENMRRYRRENPEIHRERSRKATRHLKEKVFNMYGHVCQCCGFEDIRALTLDHVNNNGAEERKALGERGPYRRALTSYKPDEYRILCMNCQFIKRVEAGRQNQHEGKLWLRQHGNS